MRGWSLEAADEMRSLLGSEAVEMQVFGEDGDSLLVDLKKTPMVSLREHLVFMELARYVIVTPGAPSPILAAFCFFLIFICLVLSGFILFFFSTFIN